MNIYKKNKENKSKKLQILKYARISHLIKINLILQIAHLVIQKKGLVRAILI